MEAIFAAALIGALVAGPLALRAWVDRKRERATAVRADMRALINRRLRGESMLSVDVLPETLWRAGRVVLSAPSGYECLTQAVMPVVVKRLPAGYELVVHPGRARATAASGDARELPRAA